MSSNLNSDIPNAGDSNRVALTGEDIQDKVKTEENKPSKRAVVVVNQHLESEEEEEEEEEEESDEREDDDGSAELPEDMEVWVPYRSICIYDDIR